MPGVVSMTVHVATSLSDSTIAVIYSDSQGSGEAEESHGIQKLYAGEDYLVGCAGSLLIVQRLFRHLHAQAHLDAAGLIAFVERFVTDEVRPESRRLLDVVAITPSGGLEPAIQRLVPSVFAHFDARTALCSIGSGADFVHRACGVPI